MLLVNPDNPSGNYVKKVNVLEIAAWAKERGVTLIVDESFVDFAMEKNASLLDEQILDNNPNLIVVKSISKSFGVPGLRLGVLATHNAELINAIKKDVAIWNINSFGEFYLQIFEKYKVDYEAAMDRFRVVREEYIKELSTIKKIRYTFAS